MSPPSTGSETPVTPRRLGGQPVSDDLAHGLSPAGNDCDFVA